MNIELHKIPVREVIKGYSDTEGGGVVGYDGRLNIRPAFQREFIYNEEQRKKVIETILKGFPLNVMYWIINDEGNYEMLDGQQRTISICQYISDDFAVGNPQLSFTNLTGPMREKILGYELMIYICEGDDQEKLDWFDTINIVGEKLTEQERRNAIYSGSWLKDAKQYFSKPNCAAYREAGNYLKGKSIRQEYLETVIKWIADRDNINVKDKVSRYMSIHQHDINCNDMRMYFNNVINWVRILFPNYRAPMQKVEWGLYYNRYHAKSFDAAELEARVKDLMMDDEIKNSSGVYEYLIDGDEKHLSLRKFSQRDKLLTYETQKGICAKCGGRFEVEEMEADHIIPWSRGGRTVLENCQVLCKRCNAIKSNK